MKSSAYGIDLTFYPTVWEVDQAKKVFIEYLRQHAKETQYPEGTALHRSRENIIQCALARVWEAGRRYQADQVQRS